MAWRATGAAGGALAAGAVAVLTGALAYGVLRAPSSPDARREPAADAATPGADAKPETAAAPAAAAAPGFDLVRVAPDGAAVIAGRAEPGSRVTILGQEGPVAEAEADAAGEFVAVFRTTPGTEPQALTLEAEDAEGARATSEDVVVLLPAAPGADPPPSGTGRDAEAGADAPATGRESSAPSETAAGETTQATIEAAPGAAPETGAASEATATAVSRAEPEAEAAPEVAATVVLRSDDAVEVTPAPGGPAADLTLASISYGETGLVTLAGVGAAGARLRAYVDDAFARDGTVDAQGRWTLELGDVAAGVYRLRIDALRPDFTVEARIETPFQRDFPAVAAPDAAGDGGARPASITVQPGNNLWTLARIHYGSGVLYTQIHTANRDLIRDPELIYPGQIFVLPEAAPAE